MAGFDINGAARVIGIELSIIKNNLNEFLNACMVFPG